MSAFFIALYRFFRRNPWFFRVFFTVLTVFIIFFCSRITLEEDIGRITGGKDSLSKDEYVIRNFKFAEKLVIHIRQTDSAQAPIPDSLIGFAQTIYDKINARFDSTYIREIMFKIPESRTETLMNLIDNHLPLFLTEEDYRILDSLDNPTKIEAIVQGNYRAILSPAGIIFKKRVAQDPLGISNLVMKKLSFLQVDDHYRLYDGYIFSIDLRHLLIFITPSNPPSETQKNGFLISALSQIINESITPSPLQAKKEPVVNADYFGSVAVAAGNAYQLKRDIIFSLSLAFLAILLLLSWYFRNGLIPFLGFLPAFFGGGLALSILYLVKGSVSVIALGVGSVILGLIIDYALYIINHFRKKRNVEQVLRDMSQTILVCSLTSVGAFLCLVFLKSAVLHDLGWFTAISVCGAALFSLVILPQFLGSYLLPKSQYPARPNVIDRFSVIDFGRKTWLIISLALAGIISLFFLKNVAFESDMNHLNYMSDELKQAERELDRVSGSSLKNVYIVSTGKDLDEALRTNETVIKTLQDLKAKRRIDSYSGIAGFLLSDSLQQVRLERWHHFWNYPRKIRILTELQQAGKKAGFSSRAFDGFDLMVSRRYALLTAEESDELRKVLFGEWIHVTRQMSMVTAVARGYEQDKSVIYNSFSGERRCVLFDRQNLTSRFVENVHIDFNHLVALSMIFVSALLWLSFGRIELGFTSAIPMFLAWLITLGFMGLFGIRFNIFNIIICSFIFGLGVDYSILMMRGLLNEYKTGHQEMQTYQASIFLSSATTLFGVAALFIARHPALNSIALISLIGIVSVVLISFTYQSLLTRWFLFKPKIRNSFPASLYIVLFSLFSAWIPISAIALILVIYGMGISLLLPLPKKKKQKLFHWIFYKLSKGYIAMNFPQYHKVDNPCGENFRKPAIIISNHQSLIETPALLRLNPKILILTTSWVYRHWVFGPVARLAGFPPIADGVDSSLAIIKQRIDEGYSILIFPEGTRSKDGHIQRFHRGAFYLAEKLHVDLLPVLIYGSGDFLHKGNFWGKPGRLFMKILPRIRPEDSQFGETYSERARKVRRYYIEEYAKTRKVYGIPSYFRLTLQLNYVFKGPVLEWYVRIKLGLEENFRRYHELLPPAGEILDLGCGFGYITYLLMLASEHRILTGVDFDDEKIRTAGNAYLANDRIRFICHDIATFVISPKNGILLGDVLHYLPPQQQRNLLHKCMENLKSGGTLLIREGIRELTGRHRRTRFSEFLSTRVVKFNRTQDNSGKLWFVSAEEIRKQAESNGLTCELLDVGKHSSNVFLVVRKP